MKPGLTLLGLGAACVACCLPLITPLIAGLGLASFGITGLSAATLGWGAGVGVGTLLLAVGAFFWVRRQRAARACGTGASCGCSGSAKA